MTTIKNLRDEDGFFYPRTHVKAVLNDDGTNVQNLINSVDEDINQAQIKADVIKSTGDGSLYLSNDGTYKKLPPIDTDEHLYITVTSNQPQPDTSLYGTKIVVTDTTDGTSETFTWNGTKIHKKIPYSHVYTIVTTPVEGYSTPEVKTFTAVLQGSNEVEISSNTCVLSFTSPVFAEVTISYDNVTRLTNSSNIIKVPYGKTVTVTPHVVEGYTAPSAFTVVANTNSKTVTLNYIQSQLKVNILSNQGEDETIDAVEATVTYGSTSVKVTNGQTIAVPSDTTISISFPEVEGYKKPEDITFNHTSGISEKTGTYYTELLTVNVTSDDGNISGFEVTISKQETVGVSTKYTRLDYIQSNGSQYLDTGITPSDDLEVEISFKPTSAVSEGAIFGSDWSTNGYFLMYYNSKWRFHTRGYVFDSSTSIDVSGFTIIKTATSSITINGSKSTWTKGTTSDSSSNILLLYCNGAYSAKKYGYGQVAYMKMWKGGTLVRDYIPVLRSDGIAGLYDFVNDTFTASIGSSNFISGSKSEEIIATQTSVTGSYKIPFDTSYIVQANSLSGYDKPSPISRVASQKSYTALQKYTLITLMDLSLYDVYGNPINRSTANCYVVRRAGQYKFPLVRGNAIKNGQVNTAAFTNNGGSYSHDFVDSGGDVITSPYISPTSVYIENADCENVISDLQLVEGDECGFVQFKVNQIPASGGNIVIEVNGGLYEPDTWSWHIWLWPHDLSPVEITNATGVKYNIMPVNLASKYDSDGVHIKNWFYQWGRKDPMLLPSAWNSTTDHSPGSVEKMTKTEVLANSLTFPTRFYYNPSSPYNWFGDKSYYNLWDAACTGTGNSDNDTVKTVYDPCPVGWKIPNGNTFTGLKVISSSNGIVKMARYSGDTVGVGFPLSGYRISSDGGLHSVGSYGFVWLSSAYSQLYAYDMDFNSSNVYPQDYSSRAYGNSVRPVQDDISEAYV